MNKITANELKTRGVSILEEHLAENPEIVITVRGEEKYVVMEMAQYAYLRECELETALHEARADYNAGNHVVESVDEHIAAAKEHRRMNYKLIYTQSYNKRAAKFLRRHPELAGQYEKTLKLLELDPLHPSLRLHQLKERLQGIIGRFHQRLVPHHSGIFHDRKRNHPGKCRASR
jgi:hypothetical protein